VIRKIGQALTQYLGWLTALLLIYCVYFQANTTQTFRYLGF